jgi:hypothetical protein
MSSITVSLIVFACVSGGAVCGTLLREALPQHHLSDESRDTVKLGMALVVTTSALVLGLLVSSAKSYYDTQAAEVTQMAARVIFLDRVLAHYGPESKEVRDLLRSAVVASLDRTWPRERGRSSGLGPPAASPEALLDEIQTLSPKDDRQRSLQAQALSIALEIGQTRWLMFEQGGTSVPKPMLVVLVFWLIVIFISFGLFAPRNLTVTAALFISGLSVSGAVFLILEMYTPFSGLIQIPSSPLRFALAHLGQ